MNKLKLLEKISKFEQECKEQSTLLLGTRNGELPMKTYDNLKIPYENTNLTLESFLQAFFLGESRLYSKYCTYLSVNTTKVYCNAGKFRTMGDLYRIVLYYYPDTTLLELLKVVVKLVESKVGLNTRICGDINKRVYYYGSSGTFSNINRWQAYTHINDDTLDELDLHPKDYLDILNLEDDIAEEVTTEAINQ